MSPEIDQGLKAYRRMQVESMSPGELVLAAYDVAIQACEQRNARRAGEAVYELMSGLDFTYTDVAGKLVVLYDWIYRQIKEGQFEEARRFLIELRETWASTINTDREPPDSAGQLG